MIPRRHYAKACPEPSRRTVIQGFLGFLDSGSRVRPPLGWNDGKFCCGFRRDQQAARIYGLTIKDGSSLAFSFAWLR